MDGRIGCSGHTGPDRARFCRVSPPPAPGVLSQRGHPGGRLLRRPLARHHQRRPIRPSSAPPRLLNQPEQSAEPTSSDPGTSGDAVTGGEPGGQAAAEASQPAASPSASPTAATEPSPTARPRPTAAADAEPFAMNLYRKGDFVAQYTFEWCVGASLQMALNMVTSDPHDARRPAALWEMARDRSFSPFGGANPTRLDGGPERARHRRTSSSRCPPSTRRSPQAAEAIRATERPVGLVMWRGRHAWVMSGFESTADPAKADDFKVTGIRVLDPLYPHGSSVWGSSAQAEQPRLASDPRQAVRPPRRTRAGSTSACRPGTC